MKEATCAICGKKIVVSYDPALGETREILNGVTVATRIGGITACRDKCCNRVFRNLKKIKTGELVDPVVSE